jgi:hypothetical protein
VKLPCGKHRYHTAGAAVRAVQGVRGRHGPAQRVYRCAACTSANYGVAVWHLTSDLRADSDHHKPKRWQPRRTKERRYVDD